MLPDGTAILMYQCTLPVEWAASVPLFAQLTRQCNYTV